MCQTGTMPKPKKIGSIKNSKITYPKDQNFFHSSDIPVHVIIIDKMTTCNR